MNKRLTNTTLKGFLTDFEKNSETTILEEGKEKRELEKIAEARGIQIKNSKDLAVFKTIYAFTDEANANGAILPKKDLLKVLPQIVGKPVNINHDRTRVVAFYIDYRYKDKEDKIMAYGIFFKSNFAEEYEHAKKLQKKKKLSSSFEIWSPKEHRKYIGEHGDFEMHKMEIAGGAFIYEEDGNLPAFKDAKVLEFSKMPEDLKQDLVYAKKYCSSDIIVGSGAEVVVEEKKEDSITNIKCSNCEEEFAINMLDTTPKCPKCKSILDRSGTMIYPPQIKDFKMLCPACRVGNWLILSNKEDISKVRCMNCSKEYAIKFKKAKDNKLLEKIQFIYSGVASCYQCGYRIPFDGSSHTKERNFKCPKCGLEFSHNIDKQNKYRTIASIQKIEVKLDNELEKSKEGGKKMETKDKKVKEKVIESKEEKVETTPKAKTSEPKESPKAEEKVEKIVKVEVKKVVKEEAPKAVEPKVEKPEAKPVEKVEDVLPADIQFESQFEKESEYEIVVALSKIDDLIVAKTERKELSDNMFAVIITAKNKKTGKSEKIRKFPIHDEDNIKNSLAILGKSESREILKKLNISVNDVKRKILKRARQLKIKSLKQNQVKASDKIKTFKEAVRKVTKQLIEANKKVELYKANAKEIVKRQAELGETELTDEEILNEDKFALAKAEKENALLIASANKGDEIVSSGVEHDDKWYADKRKEIDKKAGLA